MGVTYQHLKRYQNFYGLDLKANDLEFPEQYASGTDNIVISKTGSIEKRLGYQPHAETGPNAGLFVYNRIDELGQEQPEVIGVSDTLQKLLASTLTVTYTGSDANAVFSVFFDTDTDQYRCQIDVGTTTVLDSALGLGRDEVSPKTIDQLRAEIDALPDLTATVSGATSTPAAFIECVIQYDLTSGAYGAKARYWASLNVSPQTGKTGPLEGSQTHLNDDDFENASAVVLQNCLYVSNGYDDVIKYDGQNAYRAGLPTASDVTASGTVGANIYVYRSQYVQTDAALNTAEGNLTNSVEYSFTEPSVNNVTVTVRSIQAGSGFNTNCALISGTGTGTAIPVTAGHTMKAGDTAFLYDTVTAAYVTREVLSVGATTVTVDASIGYTSSTTNSQNVISANLRIRVFRNENTGITPTIWYELIDIPNNSLGAGTQTWVDAVSDTNVIGGIQLVEPATDRSPPTKGKYISAFQTLMVTAGDPENPNTVSVSDIENCEYFPFPDNQFTVNNLQGDLITGLHPSNENFLIFQTRSIHAMTGDVPNGNFRVDTITTDIGCAAHATIQDVRGTVCFLSPVGPRVMTGASIPQGLGQSKDNALNSRLDPLFSQRGVTEAETYRLKRAIALNDRRGEKYLLFVPAEQEVGGDRYTNANSKVLVYDYTRDAWVTWSGLDFSAGLVSTNDDNDLYFIERRVEAGVVENYLYRFLNTGTSFDYQDHNSTITAIYKSPWEFMGEAGVRKNFQNIRVYGIEDQDKEFTVTIETESNFTPDNVISTCSLTFGAGGYGVSEYGVDPYGDPSTTGLKHKLNNGRVTSLRVILSNAQEQTNISVTGYELEIAAPYKPAYKT